MVKCHNDKIDEILDNEKKLSKYANISIFKIIILSFMTLSLFYLSINC